MYRGIIALMVMLAVLAGCAKQKKQERVHSNQSVYEMYLQRGINSLNTFTATHDSTQLKAAEHYLDSASRQQSLVKLVVGPRISLFLYANKVEEARKYAESIDAAQFPRPYMKEMYLHFLNALILNKKQDIAERDESMKQAVAAVETYLQKKPNDTDAISDLFSLKTYSEPKEKLLSEMDEYKQKHPDSKVVIDKLKHVLQTVMAQEKKK